MLPVAGDRDNLLWSWLGRPEPLPSPGEKSSRCPDCTPDPRDNKKSRSDPSPGIGKLSSVNMWKTMGSREEERLAPSHTACGGQPDFGLVSFI